MRFKFNDPRSRPLRQQLRQNITKPENILWYYLRNRRFNNLKFRRQYSVGRYILDFYCPQKKIAIEVDGDSHFSNEAIAYDQQREDFLLGHGIKTLRFTNHEIVHNLPGVLESLADNLLPHP
jgi:very-short-patch-repair endonuclease